MSHSSPSDVSSAVGGPGLSLIVPTRQRVASLNRLLFNLEQCTADPQWLEVVLVVDEDDPASANITPSRLQVRLVTVPPGLKMGELNRRGFAIASGAATMLLNDDVIPRTPGWDERVRDVLATYRDGIVLVHVNDLLFQERLCTFPLVTRTYAELADGICPPDFLRYRIDDHIYNIFNMLSVAGHTRIVYLPDVVFEHDNYLKAEQSNNHLGVQELNGRTYTFNESAMEQDARRFDELLPLRKEVATKLLRHISSYKAGFVDVAVARLSPLTDSFSIRTPAHVIVNAPDAPLSTANTRVTVAVVSADIESAHSVRCVELLKKHTQNFDLVVVDNNRSAAFNHAREMNRIISAATTDLLVLLDDDVFVDDGWLDGLLAAVGPRVGLVTPLHRDRTGHISYSGVCLRPDGQGHHTHFVDVPSAPRRVPTVCSAAMLLDLRQCAGMWVDEQYAKYFLDLDLGLRFWEAGLEVICTPKSVVTHLGGATLPQSSERANEQFERDRRLFAQQWIESGRLHALEQGRWQIVPELKKIVDISYDGRLAVARRPGEASVTYQQRMEQMASELLGVPALHRAAGLAMLQAALVVDGAETAVSRRLCELAGQFGPYGLVARNRDGYVILRAEQFFAFESNQRPDLRKVVDGKGDLQVLASERLSDLEASIRGSGVASPQPRSSSTSHVPMRQSSALRAWAKQFQLARDAYVLLHKTRDRVWSWRARRLSLADVAYLTLVDLRAAANHYAVLRLGYERYAGRRRWFSGIARHRSTPNSNLRRFGLQRPPLDLFPSGPECGSTPLVLETPQIVDLEYRGYTTIAWAGGFLAVDRERMPSNVGSSLEGLDGVVFASQSLDGLRRRIDSAVPRLVRADYRGSEVYLFEHKYFAIRRSDGPFEYGRFLAGGYDTCDFGNTLVEVQSAIDVRLTAMETVSPPPLVLCALPPVVMAPFLAGLNADPPPRLVVASTDRNAYPGYDVHLLLDEGRGARRSAFRAECVGPGLRHMVDAKGISEVVVPWSLPDSLGDSTLEQLAVSLAPRVRLVTPDQAGRIYAGENLHRLVYNKAYLASMFQLVPPVEGLAVLEVGCSDGLVCDLMAVAGARRVVGVDVMLSVGCGFRSPAIEYHTGAGENLHFASDQSFDLVFSIATLEHVSNPLAVMREMKRVMRCGGYGYVQAGPLFHSPFGHHMFAYFNDQPWVHLSHDVDGVVALAQSLGVDCRIEDDLGLLATDYIGAMLSPDHINGLVLGQYGLAEMLRDPDLRVLKYAVSREGEGLLGHVLPVGLDHYSRDDLTTHGFELVFQRVR